MINPQMMGMGGFPEVPSVEELWKQEKAKYRHWIVLFMIAIITLTTLATTIFVLNLTDYDHIVKTIFNNRKNDNTSMSDVKSDMLYHVIIPAAFQMVAFIFGLVYYVITVRQSYQKKSFAHLSQWSTFIVGFAAIISGYELMSMAWSHSFSSYATKLSTGIFGITFNILSVIIYFIVSVPVGRIRRLFQISTRIEELKKDPQFRAMQEQFGHMMGQTQGQSPFGPGVPPKQQTSTTGAATAAQPNVVKPKTPEISPEEKKLRNMSVKDLKSVAKELLISGYSTMQKQELIDSILRVTNSDEE